MPLKSGSSQKIISANIKELMKKPGKTRAKGIRSLASSSGLGREEAQRKQAIAIALSKAKKPKK
jgi:hypothetical protein